ncbi:MAG: hypothetical protein KJZ59_01300 [Pararhodobacter sp.]|nr:hypothetical protein [Pararhodobacter sp.]
MSACFETEPLTQAASRGLQPASGPAEVSVLGDSVTVQGPIGYCIDTEATRESDIEAFVLLVRCRGTLRPAPVLSATITGLTAPTGDDPDALRRLTSYLRTPAGRAQLSRSGDPAEVTVTEATYADDAIWLLIEDRGNPASFDPTYWRAVLPVAGRIVTLSVLSAREHPLDRGSGLATLRNFVTQMRRANPD